MADNIENPNAFRANVAILAGGEGTRLRSRIGSIPKPMTLIGGRPLLEYQIASCRSAGFKRIVILVHYQHEFISSYFGDGSRFGVDIKYCIESSARGTAGALRDAANFLDEDFLVIYGDTYFDIDLKSFYEAQTSSKNSATLFLHPNNHPQDSDLIELTLDKKRILKIHPYPHQESNSLRNLVNAGLYAMKKFPLLEYVSGEGKSDLAKNYFPDILLANHALGAYISPEYIKDMGTPSRLDQVERDIASNKPSRLSSRANRVAIFVDRDGTINEEVNYLKDPNQLKMIEGASQAIRIFNEAGFLTICVTNQPVIARGEVTETGLNEIHARLESLMGVDGAYLDDILVCPHHPDSGFLGERLDLKVVCECRKPSIGLLTLAIEKYQICTNQSWMIGDTTSDVLAGQRAGLRTILLRSGYGGSDKKYSVEPDFVADNMMDAARWILNSKRIMENRLSPVIPRILNGKRVVLISGNSCSGKSTVSRLLKEMLKSEGRGAVIISLDGWLKDKLNRHEGVGILNRYDMDGFNIFLSNLLSMEEEVDLKIPFYQKFSGTNLSGDSQKIHPNDILIIEGIPALLDKNLLNLSSVRVAVTCTSKDRIERIYSHYNSRGQDIKSLDFILASRDLDEVPFVEESFKYATHTISTSI
jgi:histidinol-phosphate phosphatase family protein